APCSTHRALSRSAALRKVTKAQGGCPKSFVLWGCSPKRPRKRRTSLKLAWRGTLVRPLLCLPNPSLNGFPQRRAKLFRFASENDLPEWKERGTGDVKLLKHKEKGTIRLLMRRDKTLKICANHYSSDRAWVWNTHADFADECPKQELLAIRFLNAENAQKFKTKFEECRKEIEEREKKGSGKNDSAEKVAEKLEALSVKEGKEPENETKEPENETKEVTEEEQ
ncbi:hypothetical protein E2I00_006166, partial [Balaenoptera physalus]